jgi:hypothetical protein
MRNVFPLGVGKVLFDMQGLCERATCFLSESVAEAGAGSLLAGGWCGDSG